MKESMSIILVFLSTVVVAQRQPELLEPLLPFAEAVEKAKAETPQGWYTLAIHYAKGVEIERDITKARQFLQKACDANYGNAVLVSAMIDEYRFFAPHFRQRGVSSMRGDDESLFFNFIGYTGTGFPGIRRGETISNVDEATIRAKYERANKLGISVATNELARFERRVAAMQEESRKQTASANLKEKNSELAESLFQGQIQSEELSAPVPSVPSDVFDMKGQTFKWEAGGKEGLTFDVLIRVAPLTPTSSYHIIEKATITIDKDGRIIKIEGKPDRTRIKG